MKTKVSLGRRAYFSAGLRLHHPAWSDARNREVFGKRSFPHGHDYTLDVFYQGEVSDEDGMIVNLSEIKPIIAEALEPIDGKFLDCDVAFFQTHRPTAENIVEFIWKALPSHINTGRLVRLRLQETSKSWTEKTENTMRVTRQYEFAAAHRLYAAQLPDTENFDRYGKCSNPAGHGHNYQVEVTIEGVPDSATGSIIAPDELDRIVEEEVFERFDHKHLNEDCPEFAALIPTSENFARVIFDCLQPRLAASGHRLAKIGLRETTKNYFEVEA